MELVRLPRVVVSWKGWTQKLGSSSGITAVQGGSGTNNSIATSRMRRQFLIYRSQYTSGTLLAAVSH